MTHAELSRKLRALGCAEAAGQRQPRDLAQSDGQSLGSDPQSSGDIPMGTLRAILKQLGIQQENLDSL